MPNRQPKIAHQGADPKPTFDALADGLLHLLAAARTGLARREHGPAERGAGLQPGQRRAGTSCRGLQRGSRRRG